MKLAIKRPFAPPKLVQRLSVRGVSPLQRFLTNQKFQVMGDVEFEGGNPSRAVRHLGEVGKIASVFPHGYQTLVIYDPEKHDRESLVLMLTALWDGSFVPSQRADFLKENPQRRLFSSGEGFEYPNAWLDIVNNVYWTQLDVNIADVQQSMRMQAKHWDRERLVRQGKQQQAINRAERAGRGLGVGLTLREQMIASGQLKPR